MVKQTKKIAVLLPYAENFTPLKAGAISLFTYEMALNSKYKNAITVYGKNGLVPYEKVAYTGLKPIRKWLLGRNCGLAEAFYRQVKKDGYPDVIEIHNRPQMLNYLKKRLPHVKMAIHFHNDSQSMRDSRTPSERLAILEKADAVYCVSEFVKNRFFEGVECSEEQREKVQVVYNGIRRLSEKLPEKEETILYAGRLVEEKGILELAQAMGNILPKYPNWKFIVVGAKRHGQYDKGTSDFEKKIYKQLDALGGQCEVLGHRPYDQVLRMYQKAAVVVVPSKWDEPLGRTAIEALAEGCALISSKRGGLSEISNGCGLVLSDVTVREIEEKLEILLSSPEELKKYQKLSWDAYNRFELDKVAKEFDSYRERVL